MAGKPTAKQFTVHFEGSRTVIASDAEDAAETVGTALARAGFDGCECECHCVQDINQSTED